VLRTFGTSGESFARHVDTQQAKHVLAIAPEAGAILYFGDLEPQASAGWPTEAKTADFHVWSTCGVVHGL
jgi:hypothetical protein